MPYNKSHCKVAAVTFVSVPFLHNNQNNQDKIEQMPAKCSIFHSLLHFMAPSTCYTLKVEHLQFSSDR